MSQEHHAGRDPDVLNAEELATRLGLSAQTVRRMATGGQIPGMKTGKNWRFYWPAVKAMLAQPSTAPLPDTPEQGHDRHEQ